MALADLTDWMDEYTGSRFVWYVKRLSANDTLANKSHQAGPYIPKEFLFRVFPQIHQPEVENPDVFFLLYIDSHADGRPNARAVWYNNRLRGGTRNEARVTGLGGSSSALLDPDNTGALAVFVFVINEHGAAQECHVWVCEHETEEDIIEDRIGPIEPGQWLIWSVDGRTQSDRFTEGKTSRSCWLEPDQIPVNWLDRFPTGADIVMKSIELCPGHGLNPDHRLLKRRSCEFDMFRSVEAAFEMDHIQEGFKTIDEFLARAQTILQRRKSRSGRSLELHTRHIFIEEGLKEGTDFSYQPESEPGRRPDFLFPSQIDYKNPLFPQDDLRMLAVKTTCKDRWRQVLEEAYRIPNKHLLTLQEGVSESQFRKMAESGIQLVVPSPLTKTYPESVRPHLQSLESFISDVRLLTIGKTPPYL